MNTKVKLLVHPLPQAGESTQGYCLRLAHANGHSGLYWLHAMAKKVSAGATVASPLELLTGFGHETLSLLQGPCPRFLQNNSLWRHGLKTTYWNESNQKWCPKCLAKHGIWKAEWTLSLQIACTEHCVQLEDICPGCSRLIPWERGRLFHCHCGFDLRGQRCRPADTLTLDFARLLSSAFEELTSGSTRTSAIATSWPQIAHLHLQPLCDICWIFGAYTNNPNATKPQKIPGHGQLKVVIPLLKMGLHVLSDWPNNFHRFLLSYTRPVTSEAASLKIFLGELHQAMLRVLKHPDLHFMLEEFEQFVHQQWSDVLIQGRTLNASHPIMSGESAAKQLGISVRRLKTLLASGAVIGHYMTSANNRTRLVIERASVDLFQKQTGPMISLRESANLLRISLVRLRLLIDRGYFQPVMHEPDSGTTRRMHMSQEAIRTFLASLNHGQKATYSANANLISVYGIWKWWLRGDDAFIALIEALRTKQLIVVGRDPGEYGLRALLIERTQFKTWHQKYRASQPCHSIPDAARILHIDEDVLYQLSRQRIIKTFPHSCDKNGRSVLGIHDDDLHAFQQTHLWGAELSMVVGLPLHTASRQLKEAGLKPIYMLLRRGTCSYVFTRESIIKWIANKARQEPSS